ncbi:MAG: hypothetical protein AB7F99_04895 [Vicinamibacterales bacterium]
MKRSTIAIGLLCVLLIAPAGATVIVPATLAELSQDARVIARGRVIETAPRWTGDWRSIETLVTLSTEDTLKGSAGPTVSFRVPGGQVGRYKRVVVGAPEFHIDQRVVVFLNDRGSDVPYLLGLSQGVFRLVQQNGDWMVTPAPAMATSVLPQPLARGDLARHPLSLAEFERNVRALVGDSR